MAIPLCICNNGPCPSFEPREKKLQLGTPMQFRDKCLTLSKSGTQDISMRKKLLCRSAWLHRLYAIGDRYSSGVSATQPPSGYYRATVAHQAKKNNGETKGKVAIVTDEATRIGEEAVRIFTKNGAFVVIVDIKDELGHSLATSFGLDKVSYQHCDVRDENEVAKTVAFTVEKYNSLDIMFSNAGITGSYSSILDLDLKEFDNTMAINVRGVAAPSSTRHVSWFVAASFAGGAGHEYTVSKHDVLGLVRSTCDELGAYGIRVNFISPYALAMPMTCVTLDVGPTEVEAATYGSANLEGITLKANHIAEAALFLASDESLYISGHNLVVDGGYSAVNHWLPKIQKDDGGVDGVDGGYEEYVAGGRAEGVVGGGDEGGEGGNCHEVTRG
ncbi:hypothetical protein V8G54_003935 [Vigna mungo]|uniref:Uncharacterized protein n=1 Tax=Vigna mungo TaxID=3915 RepID=A0AAQ3PAW4_VIGMU